MIPGQVSECYVVVEEEEEVVVVVVVVGAGTRRGKNPRNRNTMISYNGIIRFPRWAPIIS